VIERIERGIKTLERERERERERESKGPEQRDGMRENLRKIYEEEEGTEIFEPLFLLLLLLLTSMF
jgi:hypothetical protein